MMIGSILKRFHDEVLRDVSALGGSLFTTLGVVLIILIGKVSLFVELVVGLVVVYMLGIGIRQIYFKERPKKLKYTNWPEKIYASSFPSIHSMRTWLYVMVFGLHFDNLLLWIVLICVGIIVAYSRMYLEKHDFVDVVVGSMVGIVVGIAVVLLV